MTRYLDIDEVPVKIEDAIRDRVGHLTEKGCEVWAAQMRSVLTKLMK